MNINRRDAVVTLPTNEIFNVRIHIDTWKPLAFIKQPYLAARTILTANNIESVVNTTMLLSDPNMVGRFILMSRHNLPHNNLEIDVYYDTKYNDIIVIPSLDMYSTMSCMRYSLIDVSGYGINFSGMEGDSVPALLTPPPVPGGLPTPTLVRNINVHLTNIAKDVDNTNRGLYYEHMLTPNLNFSSPSMFPSIYLEFGLPSSIFVLDTTSASIVENNVIVYQSLMKHDVISTGKKLLTDVDTLVVEIPI